MNRRGKNEEKRKNEKKIKYEKSNIFSCNM